MDSLSDIATEETFVPHYGLIMEHSVSRRKGGKYNNDVTLPQELLHFILRRLLAQVDFDERQYLRCNPDVAEAVEWGSYSSGREHFIKLGYFEGRRGATPVNEAWYLARNPDVAAAKATGMVESGELQYRLAGADEWREPTPESVLALKAWKDVLVR